MSKLYLFALSVACLAACDKPVDAKGAAKEQSHLDAQLVKVNVEIAMLEADLRTNKMFECALMKATAKVEPKNKFIDEMKESSKNQCAIAQTLVDSTTGAFSKLKNDGKLALPLYLFTTYKNDGDGAKELRVGVFDSIEKCEAVETQLRNSHLPTSKCIEWKPTIGSLKSS